MILTILSWNSILSWQKKIKAKKFYIHNQEWVDSMEQFDENMDWNGYMEGGQWDDNDYAHGLDPRIWEDDSDLE